METTIVCPSGLSGRIRPLTARAASVLTDAKAIRSGRAADSILKACWVETLDLGPYPFERDVDWSKVLICDRTYALMGVRIATYGDTYEINQTCANCENRFFWDVPLSEIPKKELSDLAKTQISSGTNEFESTMMDGRKIVWKLLTGKDLAQSLPKIRDNRDDLIVQVVKCRVKSIEGLDTSRIEEYLSGLGMGEIQNLSLQMDEVDGGLETEIEIRCPSCHLEWPIELPLDLVAMFSLRRKTNMARRHAGPFRE